MIFLSCLCRALYLLSISSQFPFLTLIFIRNHSKSEKLRNEFWMHPKLSSCMTDIGPENQNSSNGCALVWFSMFRWSASNILGINLHICEDCCIESVVKDINIDKFIFERSHVTKKVIFYGRLFFHFWRCIRTPGRRHIYHGCSLRLKIIWSTYFPSLVNCSVQRWSYVIRR